MIVPDSIDPIIAWRVWKFADVLGSLNTGVPVFPGVPQMAVCHSLRSHEVPAEDCSCGIYALPTMESARDRLEQESRYSYFNPISLFHGNFAIGQVYLWGKVVEHQGGFRAEFAYPKTILTPLPAQTERLAKLYNIEKEESCTWEKLFEREELSYWEPSGRLMSWAGLARTPSSPPTVVQQKTRNKRWLPSAYQSKPNRSVPSALREQVAQKEENAKSDFWRRI